jgi:hypothetical protein
MPDSFPPLSWGQPPFDERDLDALLSGETTDTPLALRQVADALTALRAGPAQAELAGEAAIRAEFRSVVLDEAARTDGHPYAQVLSALTLDRGSRPPARHRSRRLARSASAAGPAGPDRRAPARPRRARRGRRRIGRPGGALLGVAVLVLVVAAVAFTGSLPGPIQRLTHLSSNNSSTAAQPGSVHPSQQVNGSGTTVRATHRPTLSPSPHPGSAASPKRPAQTQAKVPTSPRGLCRAYYHDLQGPQTRQNWSAELALLKKLGPLAGGGYRVPAYCARYVADMFPHMPWWAYPTLGQPPGAPNQPGNASPGSSQPDAGSAGSERAHESTVPVPAVP